MSLSPLNLAAQSITSQTRAAHLESKIVGQSLAVTPILRRLALFEANLNDKTRPVGVFLLLGPTGTGKTHTVEELARALHFAPSAVLKIDCGEFQADHEVARLIGAPPGYLGHKETKALLSQAAVDAVRINMTAPGIVLFDEIEKASGSLTRLLLGVLDKATISLGDNTKVNFSNSLIFLTSNLGADAMQKLLNPVFGFESFAGGESPIRSRLESIGLAAVRRKFSPEFVNRIDEILLYEPLTSNEFSQVLDLELDKLKSRIDGSGDKRFMVEVSPAVREHLLEVGISKSFGARHLKRTLDRLVTSNLATLVNSGEISRGDVVMVDLVAGEIQFFKIGEAEIEPLLLIPDESTVPKVMRRKVKGD